MLADGEDNGRALRAREMAERGADFENEQDPLLLVLPPPPPGEELKRLLDLA